MQTENAPQTTEAQEEPQPAGIILERHHLAAAAFAGAAGRYSMQAVNVKPDGTVEATNGHYAIRVPASRFPAQDFPAVDGMGKPLSAPILIPADALKTTERTLPKAGKCQIPILGTAHLGNGDGTIKVTTTDLEAPLVRTALPVGGVFPDLDSIIPETSDKSLTIGLSPSYLKDIAAYASKVGARCLELTIPAPKAGTQEQQVIFRCSLPDGQKATIVLMPMRVS